ncbi:MAG: protein-L-isoaspartate O-methyltransferase family protein [Stellaceae bacterium]
MPGRQKRPQQHEQAKADASGRTANITRLMQGVLGTEGLNRPRPFGRVEGGAYVQNEDLASALKFARKSLPGQVKADTPLPADQAPVSDAPPLPIEQIRRWYAEELRFTGRVGSSAVIDAFATVPRERFLGPGPWRIRSPMNIDAYWSTADASPRQVYHDVLVALDEARGINNGQPSLWARLFDNLDIRPGEVVLHLGCGTGYFSAIAGELVGPTGRVAAIEIDAGLAEKAREALAPWPQVTVSNADGAGSAFDPVDVAIASAGVTHPLPAWVNALKPGGRLLVPMTTTELLGNAELSTSRIALSAGGGPGAMLLVVRQAEDQYTARFLCRAGFIDFKGARNSEESRRLAAALVRDWGDGVKSLRRDSHSEDGTCWLHGAGWCLSHRVPTGTPRRRP